MANPAIINPNRGQRATRAMGRIKTLRIAIEDAQAKNKPERVASLQAELDKLLSDIAALKAELESIL